MAQAQPGPFPQWCPGEFWDPIWGGNPDGFHCHDGGPGWQNGNRGWNHDDGRGRGGLGGWNHDDGHGGPGHDDGRGGRR